MKRTVLLESSELLLIITRPKSTSVNEACQQFGRAVGRAKNGYPACEVYGFDRRMPGFGTPLWVVLAAPGCPDKKQLIEVQDFFKYTEKAGAT